MVETSQTRKEKNLTSSCQTILRVCTQKLTTARNRRNPLPQEMN